MYIHPKSKDSYWQLLVIKFFDQKLLKRAIDYQNRKLLMEILKKSLILIGGLVLSSSSFGKIFPSTNQKTFFYITLLSLKNITCISFCHSFKEKKMYFSFTSLWCRYFLLLSHLLYPNQNNHLL